MSQINGFPLVYQDAMTNESDSKDDSATPRIVKNLERMTIQYRKYVDSEIFEEQKNRDQQAENVERLKKSKQKKPTKDV